jgi:hypothetical protein
MSVVIFFTCDNRVINVYNVMKAINYMHAQRLHS